MKTLCLLLCLLPSLTFAQVTGQCGAGRTCTVRQLILTSSSGSGAQCYAPPGTGTVWSWLATSTALSLYSGATCTAPTMERFGWANSLGLYSATTVNASTGYTAGASGTGTAFASFPAAASSTGRLLYDATNRVWRWSDGTNWNVLAQEYVVNAYHPALAPGTGVTLSYGNTRTPTVVRQISGQTLTLGTGAGTFTVEVYDQTAAAVRCTSAALTCNAANQFATACSGAIPAGNAYAIRINSAACATTPVLNLTALLTGG